MTPEAIAEAVRAAHEPLISAEIERIQRIGEEARAEAVRKALESLQEPANDQGDREPPPPSGGPSRPRKSTKKRTAWSQMSKADRSAEIRRRWEVRRAKSATASVTLPKPHEADGAISVVAGDCLDVLPRIPNGSVDLIVTSPPYPDHGLEYERPGETSIQAWTDLMGDFLSEADEVLKPGGNLWINVGFERVRDERGHDTRQRIPLTYRLAPIAEAVGLQIMNEVVWLKAQHQNTSRHRLSTKSERWLWLFKPGAKPHFDIEAVRVEARVKDRRNNPRGSNPADVWGFATVNGNDRRRVAHPCQWPEEMIERIVSGWSKPGDLILDPFAGSGTIGPIAERLGRRALLIERHEPYVEIAKSRLAA